MLSHPCLQTLQTTHYCALRKKATFPNKKQHILLVPTVLDSRITLHQLLLLNLSGPVLVEGLEDTLPLVYVIEELLELVQIDRPRGVLVKHIWENEK